MAYALGFKGGRIFFCGSAAGRSKGVCRAWAVEGKTSHCLFLLDHLKLRITDLISRFQSDSLPIDYAQERIDMTYIEAQKDKMFARQLNCLKVRTERVQLAIEDFCRAFEQRTRWVKDKLLIDDDLAVYEDKLRKE
ncbi:MAG: ABC-three component system protein [Janthinobacterium lividum]